MKVVFLLTQLWLILSSCSHEEVIDPGALDLKQQLVVYSILTPGDSCYVYVGKTFLSTDHADSYSNHGVYNAKVILANSEGRSINLLQASPKQSIYCCSQNTFPILPGAQYRLVIMAEGFPTLNASTLVPAEPTTFTHIGQQNVVIPEDNYEVEAIEINCYWLLATTSELGTFVTTSVVEEYTDSSGSYQDSSFHDFSCGDITQTGNEYSVSFQTPYYRYSEVITECSFPSHHCEVISSTLLSELRSITIYLTTTDEHLNKFLQAANLYSDIWFTSDSFLDQFRGILPEYTNIENGVGVFGSCLHQSYILYPKL